MNPPQGNSARFADVPLSSGGTPTSAWLAAKRRPELDLAPCRRLVVAAPHPDDETLGAGALIAQLAVAGAEVTVVSVSDGEAADPHASAADRQQLGAERIREQRCATAALGVREPICLGLPDGRIDAYEDHLTDLLTPTLARPATWCATTWRGDGHPDHEAVGRAAAVAASRTGATLLEYPVWMWHWATPEDPAVPWHRAYSVPPSDWAAGNKLLAAQRFDSQFRSPNRDTPPVLPPFVLGRLMAVGELVFL